MGVYKHNGDFNDHLMYKGQRGWFLYKAKQTGLWMVTPKEDDIAEGRGCLSSVERSSPTPVGLQWKWGDGSAWHVDAECTCSVEAEGLGCLQLF